jgi:hypothetical protein
MSDEDDLPSSPKNQSSSISVRGDLTPEMLCNVQEDSLSSTRNQSSAVSVRGDLSQEMLCNERNEHQEAMEEIGGCVLYDALLSCIESFQTADALIENFSVQLKEEKQKGHITYEFLMNSKYWFDCFMKSDVIKSDLLKQLVKECSIMKRQKVKGNLLLLML